MAPFAISTYTPTKNNICVILTRKMQRLRMLKNLCLPPLLPSTLGNVAETSWRQLHALVTDKQWTGISHPSNLQSTWNKDNKYDIQTWQFEMNAWFDVTHQQILSTPLDTLRPICLFGASLLHERSFQSSRLATWPGCEWPSVYKYKGIFKLCSNIKFATILDNLCLELIC